MDAVIYRARDNAMSTQQTSDALMVYKYFTFLVRESSLDNRQVIGLEKTVKRHLCIRDDYLPRLLWQIKDFDKREAKVNLKCAVFFC